MQFWLKQFVIVNKEFFWYKILQSPTLQPHQSVKAHKLYKSYKCLYEVIFFSYSIGYLNHSVHSPPISAGGLSLLPNFQKGGLTGSQFLVGLLGKTEVTFTGGGRGRWSSFYIKKIKFEIFNDKRSLSTKMFLSDHN